MPESPGAEKHDKEKEHRDSKKGRGLCVALSISNKSITIRGLK